VVEDARAGLDDEAEDLLGEVVRVVGAEIERGDRLLEETEGALAVRLLLWAEARRADALGQATERGVDLAGVVRGLALEEPEARDDADLVLDGVSAWCACTTRTAETMP
jgi:hypothetical protein